MRIPLSAKHSAAAARALASCAALSGSRLNRSGSASAVSILAMMPVMRSISALCFRDLSACSERLLFASCRLARRLSRVVALCCACRVAARRQHPAAIVVEVAVIGRDRAIGDDPQRVGAGLDQIAVMRDHDDGAGIVVDRLDQRRAAVDVEMVGRLVEDDHVRAVEGARAPAAAAPSRRPRGS